MFETAKALFECVETLGMGMKLGWLIFFRKDYDRAVRYLSLKIKKVFIEKHDYTPEQFDKEVLETLNNSNRFEVRLLAQVYEAESGL